MTIRGMTSRSSLRPAASTASLRPGASPFDPAAREETHSRPETSESQIHNPKAARTGRSIFGLGAPQEDDEVEFQATTRARYSSQRAAPTCGSPSIIPLSYPGPVVLASFYEALPKLVNFINFPPPYEIIPASKLLSKTQPVDVSAQATKDLWIR